MKIKLNIQYIQNLTNNEAFTYFCTLVTIIRQQNTELNTMIIENQKSEDAAKSNNWSNRTTGN